MRTTPLIALGLAGYAAFLVATVPARFVASELQSRAGDRVRVHEAHGTLWHGAARVDVALGPAWTPIDTLAWRWQPAQLFSGRLAFAVDAKAGEAAAQGTIARGLSEWHASGRASGPAAFGATVMPLLATWRPEGQLDLRTDGFAWNDREARGEILAEWRDAAVALSQVRPLGSYRATLRAEGAGGKLALATLDGALRMSGQGDIAFPSRVTFNGEARAQGTSGPALDPLLDLLGPRRADGARTLSWRMN